MMVVTPVRSSSILGTPIFGQLVDTPMSWPPGSRAFSRQSFSALCSLGSVLLGRKSSVSHTAIIGTTMGHTTLPISGQVCLDIRFAGREETVCHILGEETSTRPV